MTNPQSNDTAKTLVFRGMLSVTVGVVVIAWPAITVRVFVVLFATYLFIGAAIEGCMLPRAHPIRIMAARTLLEVVDVAAGVAALLWPGLTASVLTVLIAVWAFVAGTGQLALTIGAGKGVAERVLLGLGGFASIAFGAVFLSARPIAAVTLARVYGSFSIVTGLIVFVLAARIRSGDVALPYGRRSGPGGKPIDRSQAVVRSRQP
jgi:uncharacterized membrane protein HdeD (DUF308 family)